MNFHSSTPKMDWINEITRFQLWENSLFDLHNIIHVNRNKSQDTFQFMENQGNTMKNTVLFYFDELTVKHT